MGQLKPLKFKGHQIPTWELWVVCDESGEFEQTAQAVEHWEARSVTVQISAKLLMKNSDLCDAKDAGVEIYPHALC
ncbi:hypothetical protein Nmel_009308 [Mimus melanotis]